MVVECKKCKEELDEQDILDTGMEEICFNCWNIRYIEGNKDESGS